MLQNLPSSNFGRLLHHRRYLAKSGNVDVEVTVSIFELLLGFSEQFLNNFELYWIGETRAKRINGYEKTNFSKCQAQGLRVTGDGVPSFTLLQTAFMPTSWIGAMIINNVVG